MSLSRRNAFTRLAVAASAGALAWRTAEAAAAPAPETVPRVVYHLADADKVGFVLGNIDNHFKGMGGTDRVHIALVVHGPALAAFETVRADGALRAHFAAIAAQGVDLGACGNTLDAQGLTVAELLPGFSRIDEGGVVRLARLQGEGYAYLRP
ncbi:MAG: DsrE family protein [Devosia sp.]|nr:DsrE family protein [Devosia sp.]